jgi:hypothetical protein
MDTVTAHELAGRVRRRTHVRLSATTAQAFLEDWLPVGSLTGQRRQGAQESSFPPGLPPPATRQGRPRGGSEAFC